MNKKQVIIVLRRENNELSHGVYAVETTGAAMLFQIVNVLLRLNLPLKIIHGQCYDAAATMAGNNSDLATHFGGEEPSAIFTHCYGHSLNLAASDAVKGSELIKSALRFHIKLQN